MIEVCGFEYIKMASFVGTNKEFRRYIGPRLRNLVQQFTKTHKATISACEHCGSNDNLQSAHVHGRDRNNIIDLLLLEYTHDGIVTIDIGKFEQCFVDEHQPLEKSILILCRDCHKKYDTRVSAEAQVRVGSIESASEPAFVAGNEEVLPITLEPPNLNVFKEQLLLTKMAMIETYYSNGRIDRKPWNASKFGDSSSVYGNLRSRPEYRSGNWQAKGIVKVHVKIQGIP